MVARMNKEDDFRQRLTEYLEAVFGVDMVEIELLQPMAGGTSRDTWQIKAEVKGEVHSLVLRRDLATTMIEKALLRDQEFLVIQAAYGSGVSVPKPRWYCIEPCILDAPFMLMDFVEGTAIGKQVVELPELADARQAIPTQMGEQLAKIHNIDVTKHQLSFLSTPAKGLSPAQEAIAQLRAALTQLNVYNPVFEFGLRWAQQHAPTCEKPTLVHGDFRIGNFLVANKGLNGIVDWEFCHMGDPAEDLAWPCVRDWRFGNGALALGGIAANREPFIEAYEKASGRKIDRKTIDFWEILGNLRWAVTCLAQANRHLSGGDTSVELASLGRRSAEMQLEMLRLIEEQGL